MTQRTGLLPFVVLCLLAPQSAAVADHIDGMALMLGHGPDPGGVTLNWTGGQPTFRVYRSTSPSTILDAGNLIGTTDVRTFGDTPPLGDIFYYEIASPCVYNPPETCNGIDDDCDGATDENLGTTTCGVGACRRTVNNCMGGVNQTCTPGTPTAEICNSIDDDCDGTVDGPGSERSCSLPNAVPQCTNGVCTITSCLAGFGDCNVSPPDGCETNTHARQSTSPDYYGGGTNADLKVGFARVLQIANCGGCGVGCDDGNTCSTDLCMPVGPIGGEVGVCRHYGRAQCGGARCNNASTLPGTPPPLEPGCMGPDADGDGLPAQWETPQTDPYTNSTDLPGVDLNCDGEISDAGGDLIWHEPPAGDSRKDIYLEIDIMSNAGGTGLLNDPILGVFPEGANPHLPPNHPSTGKSAVSEVREAFAREGITLHVDPVRSEVAHHQITYLSGPSLNLICSELVDSTTGEPSVSLNSFKDNYSDPRRRLGYHYAISAHNSCSEFAEGSPGSPATDVSGTAEIGGNDMIISLASHVYYKQQFCWYPDGFPNPVNCCSPTDCCLGDESRWDPNCGISLPIRATPYSCVGAAGFEVCVSAADKLLQFQEWTGTLMHELGHNLGLCHGGIADISSSEPCDNMNYAPTNISTMNFAFQLSGILHARHDLIDESGNIIAIDSVPLRRYDFSRGVESSLDEACLDENQGLGIDTWPWYGDRTKYFCPDGLPASSNGQVISNRSGPIDWNCDGDIDTGCVSADINGDGMLGLLPSVNQWGNLFYRFYCTPSVHN